MNIEIKKYIEEKNQLEKLYNELNGKLSKEKIKYEKLNDEYNKYKEDENKLYNDLKQKYEKEKRKIEDQYNELKEKYEKEKYEQQSYDELNNIYQEEKDKNKRLTDDIKKYIDEKNQKEILINELKSKLYDHEKTIDDLNKNLEKEKIKNQRLNEEIISYSRNDNNIINLDNKKEIYEKEDKNDSSLDEIKIFLNEKSKIEKSYDNLINGLINNYSNKKKKYEDLNLKYFEKENEIKLFKRAIPLEILNEEEKILNVNFITYDESIHYSTICKNTEKLNKIIELFYDNYPEYREFKNIFRLKGKKIKKSYTFEENNINNNDIIIIESYSK